MLASGIAYLCVSTVITLCLMLAYANSKGYLEKEKLAKMAAIAQGLDESTISTSPGTHEEAKPPDTPEQPSLEDIETRRAIHMRNVELREQALDTSLERLFSQQRTLADEKDSYDKIKVAFEKQLNELHTGALATGRENIRSIWESIKPKQAKDQMIQMIATGRQEDVVAILSAMPVTKRAKIIGEFKTDEDNKKLDDILERIRRGMPEEKVIDNTKGQLDELKPKSAG
jgi:hypothetical protein